MKLTDCGGEDASLEGTASAVGAFLPPIQTCSRSLDNTVIVWDMESGQMTAG